MLLNICISQKKRQMQEIKLSSLRKEVVDILVLAMRSGLDTAEGHCNVNDIDKMIIDQC